MIELILSIAVFLLALVSVWDGWQTRKLKKLIDQLSQNDNIRCERYFVIVGLRAFPMYQPHLMRSEIPGYLTAATENHRQGFKIGSVWYAWTELPGNALKFKNQNMALLTVQILIDNDNGWLKPLTIIEIFE